MRKAATLASEHDNRLADAITLSRSQQLLIVKDRAKMVVTGHIGRGEDGCDSLDFRGHRDVERNNPPMRQRTADEFDQQLIAKRRKIIEIDSLARDVGFGRLVSKRYSVPMPVV